MSKRRPATPHRNGAEPKSRHAHHSQRSLTVIADRIGGNVGELRALIEVMREQNIETVTATFQRQLEDGMAAVEDFTGSVRKSVRDALIAAGHFREPATAEPEQLDKPGETAYPRLPPQAPTDPAK
jgi:hypothetical protein